MPFRTQGLGGIQSGSAKGDVDRNAFYGSEREWLSFLERDCDTRYVCPNSAYASK